MVISLPISQNVKLMFAVSGTPEDAMTLVLDNSTCADVKSHKNNVYPIFLYDFQHHSLETGRELSRDNACVRLIKLLACDSD